MCHLRVELSQDDGWSHLISYFTALTHEKACSHLPCASCVVSPIVESGHMFPHLLLTGSYYSSVNWLIKYFYTPASAGGNSHINTVITGQTLCSEGQACHTDFCLPLKYFITSKWKIEHPIQTYLQVIQRGFQMQCLQYEDGWGLLNHCVYLFSFIIPENRDVIND